MLVFRDGRRRVAVRTLHEQLQGTCRRAASGGGDAVLDALLRAGELECGLADAGAAAAAEVARLTDELAEALVSGRAPRGLPAGLAGELPETIAIAVPEGFAYY
ncbi:MAG TPA: hypothetical protein VLA96_02175, partial [Terriglobales bacterium]|nr:hypothetical protein [Terriglobales bacterium]